jgi:hypothetical protein
MKSIKHFFLFLAVLFGTSSLFAQTVDDIINKHLEAVGGKDKLATINSIRLEHNAEMMGNNTSSITTVLNGKGFRNESEFNGQKIIRVYTDQGGWTVNPFAGTSDPQALPDDQYKAGEDQIYIEPFYQYTERGAKAELLGQEKVGDVNAFKVKLTNKDSAASVYYFDPGSFLIIQIVTSIEMQGQSMDIKSSLSDFKKTDFGIVIPNTIEVNIGDQFSMTSRLLKAEANPTVDLSIFAMPK